MFCRKCESRQIQLTFTTFLFAIAGTQVFTQGQLTALKSLIGGLAAFMAYMIVYTCWTDGSPFRKGDSGRHAPTRLDADCVCLLQSPPETLDEWRGAAAANLPPGAVLVLRCFLFESLRV